MKRTLWIFRSNLRNKESYHSITNLEQFKKECWDFYLLQGIYYLENDDFDEVVVWRLSNEEGKIVFDINGKKFIQMFVKNFDQCLRIAPPQFSFFRGGFQEYDIATRNNPDHFGFKLYLAASKRIVPQYGGKYNAILCESETDYYNITSWKKIKQCGYFFKTVNPNIFYPIPDKEKIYDLCWICNFEQITQKGQEFFLATVSKSDFLKSLKIIHVGNKEKLAKKLAEKNNVKNIEFVGSKSRQEINEIINSSKFGIVTSNSSDGCPRVCTEILCTGTPLIVRDNTRLLRSYKDFWNCTFRDDSIYYSEKDITKFVINYDKMKSKVDINNILKSLTIKSVCDSNLSIWKRLAKKQS